MEIKRNLINRIEFNSFETEIHISCLVKAGNLSFETVVMLSSNWFNPILLFLQKENPTILLDENIERISFPDGSTQYCVHTNSLIEKNICWENFLGSDVQPKRIRA